MTEISFAAVEHCRQEFQRALVGLADATTALSDDLDSGERRAAVRSAAAVLEFRAGEYDEAAAAYSARVGGETGLCPEANGVLTCVLEPYHPGERHRTPTGRTWWVGTVGGGAL